MKSVYHKNKTEKNRERNALRRHALLKPTFNFKTLFIKDFYNNLIGFTMHLLLCRVSPIYRKFEGNRLCGF